MNRDFRVCTRMCSPVEMTETDGYWWRQWSSWWRRYGGWLDLSRWRRETPLVRKCKRRAASVRLGAASGGVLVRHKEEEETTHDSSR
jgi:hypothetical protein